MIPLFLKSGGYALRMVIAAGCCLGIWSSLTLARADYRFKKDTEESVRSAIRLEPDGWEYYMRLSEFDRAHARELLTTSLGLNRFDAQADIELGLQYEAEEDFGRAEKQLLEAYDVDHTYLPRWSLANYYFRRDNMPAFWAWARSAAAMPSDEIGPLLELCWRVAPDPKIISAAILNDKPEMIRQYINFLLAKGEAAEVARISPHLFRSGDPESDRPVLLSVVNRLAGLNDGAAANDLWHLLMEHHWVTADTTVPYNGGFQREPLPVSFDWYFPEYEGLHSWPGSSGLETEFTGSQPEGCVIAEQAVVLTPGDYTLSYAYRTSDVAPETGIQWQIIDVKSNTVLAQSSDLSSDEMKHSVLTFAVPPGSSLLRLRLAYNRTLGTPRIAGMLDLQSAQIQVLPKS